MLVTVPLFSDIDRATNVSINVIDGKLPVEDYRFPHSRTHVLLLDVRPIGIFGFAAQWGGDIDEERARDDGKKETVSTAQQGAGVKPYLPLTPQTYGLEVSVPG